MWQVLSGAFQWVPQGKQAKVLAKTPPRPCDDDILLLKLRPGQVGRSARIAPPANELMRPTPCFACIAHANCGGGAASPGRRTRSALRKGDRLDTREVVAGRHRVVSTASDG